MPVPLDTPDGVEVAEQPKKKGGRKKKAEAAPVAAPPNPLLAPPTSGPAVVTAPTAAAMVPQAVEQVPVVDLVSIYTTNRKVMYDTVELHKCWGDTAIKAATAKQLIGWETEKDWSARMVSANPAMTEESCKKLFDNFAILKDRAGNRIACWHNLDNRQLDEAWCNGLSSTVLKFQWAGPTTMPGETVNGSTITISRTGRVSSGQHTLIGLILAEQDWAKDPSKYPHWKTEPVVETIVVTGISESREVVMTTDHCRERSEADVFYTSDLFSRLSPGERQFCSRMLAVSSGFLWSRSDTKGYKTHPELVRFVDRHPTLLKCLNYIVAKNSAKAGRPLTSLGLSAGQCVAIMYLTGSGMSDGDTYRNGAPPGEKTLDWTLYPKAEEFFAELGKNAAVQTALGDLASDDDEVGDAKKKLAIVAKAWDAFSHNLPITLEDLRLEYSTDEKTKRKVLLNLANFGGIDVVEKSVMSTPDPTAPTPTEIAKGTELENKRRAIENINKIRASKGQELLPLPTE